jgi:hypothetical protein
MKTGYPLTYDTVTNDYHNEVGVVVHAEWQMNKFHETIVDNTPSEDDEGYDIELFPIESVVKPNRPKAGIIAAVVGQSFVDQNYHDEVPPARYYTIDREDQYKYWQSPTSGTTLTDCKPQVTYVEEDTENPVLLEVNKIHFTVENTYASPTEYDIQIDTGSGWVTVESDLPIPAGGKVELWYNGTDWTTTQNLDNTIEVQAVRLVVNTMDTDAFFNLIELGLALELDLSKDVIGFSDNFNMGEADFITPLGQISSNEGSVSLFNDTQRYTNRNEDSILHGLLDKGVIFRCWMKYTKDGDSELVPEFELFSETWSESEEGTEVALVDGSKFFMDIKPRPVLYRNIPVQEAIWRICDCVGFNKYNVEAINQEPHSSIDIFWVDGEKTAWETFAELARATQTAIYFDSFGVLQIKTRKAAWDKAKSSTYDFNRVTDPGGQPSNIITLSESNEYEANKVTVNWSPTDFSEQKDQITPYEIVWEPEGSVVLRSTPLAENLLIGDDKIMLPTKEGSSWPWKGFCNIEGEWIEFDAKRYVNYADGPRKVEWVEDFERQKRIDESTAPEKRHLNKYTGALRIKERGAYNTEEKNHFIDMNGWTKSRQKNYGATDSPSPGAKLNLKQSSVTVSGPKRFGMNDYTYLHRGTDVDQGFWYVGTRLQVDPKGKDKTGGIFFNADDGLGTGYFLEVMASSRLGGKMRNKRNEVQFYSMKGDGSKKVYGGETIRVKDRSKNHRKGAKIKKDIGAKILVSKNRWIDFDIWFEEKSNGDHRFQVFAYGNLLFEAIVPSGSGWQHSRIGKFGMFARGHSSVTFDYIYAINNLAIEPIDGESYFDRIEGSYTGNQLWKDWIGETRTVKRKVRRKWKKYQQRYKQQYIDDFGPMVHEIRKFNVKYTPDLPVLESKLYFSNDTQAVCSEFTGDIKNAEFMMINISREDAIIHGEDERTALGNGTIDHKLFVYGRPVIQKDSQTEVRSDDWSIRRRGLIETEYDSPWIQNRSEANRFAEWLTDHWAHSDTVLEVEVFGNPLIELTDVVTVSYRHIHHRFYVVNISNSFEQGYGTTLQLRKVPMHGPSYSADGAGIGVTEARTLVKTP